MQTKNGKTYRPFMNYSNTDQKIEIIEYRESLTSKFRELNVAWLQKYFYVEPIDEEILSRPEQFIIHKGGYIFFSTVNNEVAGTFALIRISDHVYELGKMAVDERYRGRKVGNRMVEFCLLKAKELGANKVILYSNTKLKPAIHLYKKYGFVEVPMDSTIYKRSDIKMERTL